MPQGFSQPDAMKTGTTQGGQRRVDNQPVPDQRFYTKTNFFTISGGEGGLPQDMSVADKYNHLHSQKMSRRSNKMGAATSSEHPNPLEFSPQTDGDIA